VLGVQRFPGARWRLTQSGGLGLRLQLSDATLGGLIDLGSFARLRTSGGWPSQDFFWLEWGISARESVGERGSKPALTKDQPEKQIEPLLCIVLADLVNCVFAAAARSLPRGLPIIRS
jgi:hypothetical protein